jgi:hypothetical protein
MILELFSIYLLLIGGVGLALSYGLFRKRLSWFEHLIFGFTLGLIVPNVAYASLWLIFGLQFTLVSWLITYAGFLMIGILLIAINKWRDNGNKEIYDNEIPITS